MLRHWRIILFLIGMLALGITQLPVFSTNAERALGSVIVSPQPQPAPRPAALKQATGCTYLVHYGDNLFRIGLRYGVSYNYLASLNGIPNPNLIYAGSVIAVPCGGRGGAGIPANCAPPVQYTVVKGDNLFRIAYNNKTDLNLLRSVNNMYGRVLRPGMVLTVPCPGSVQYREVPPVEATEPAPGITPTGVPPPATVPPGTSGPEIILQNGAFDPQTLEVLPGTTVTWTNMEASARSIVVGNLPASPAIQPGASWSFTFDTQGIYTFQLKNDPNVNGTITVRNP